MMWEIRSPGRRLALLAAAALALSASGCAPGQEETPPASKSAAPPPSGGGGSSPAPAPTPEPGSGDAERRGPKDSAEGGSGAPTGEATFVGAQPGVATDYIAFGDRPSEPDRVEATEDAIAIELRWQGWGTRKAVASGRARVNTCEPTCADGRIQRREGAQVVLSGLEPGECRGRSGQFYTRARVSWPEGLGLPEGQSVELAPRCVE